MAEINKDYTEDITLDRERERGKKRNSKNLFIEFLETQLRKRCLKRL